jgi:HD-GYP domain-containing protein (c-di-GMP phosphodiesterase class II)
LKEAEGYIQDHHEWYDGSGYPNGKRVRRFPLGAQVLRIADAVDAMLSDRACRKALSMENTIIQLERCSGTQFDPTAAAFAIGLLSNKKILKEVRKSIL